MLTMVDKVPLLHSTYGVQMTTSGPESRAIVKPRSRVAVRLPFTGVFAIPQHHGGKDSSIAFSFKRLEDLARHTNAISNSNWDAISIRQDHAFEWPVFDTTTQMPDYEETTTRAAVCTP